MSPRPETSEPVQLRPVEFEILLTLASRDYHGYGILQESEARTGGALRLETATLYRALRRLVTAGLVARRADPADGEDERRQYYGITPKGRAAAAGEASRLARQVAAARAARLLPREQS
jgi:DNA-binding PadR family transcriptional regulator